MRMDGDLYRENLCSDLGFSDEDRIENLRRVSAVADQANKQGITVIASYVSPTEKIREVVRENIGNLKIVSVKCSSEECAVRDVKGMWAKAKAGEIKGFTGYDAPYEPPVEFEIELDTDAHSFEENQDKLRAHFGI